MTYNVEHFFLCLFALCISFFGEVSVEIFYPLILFGFLLSHWVLLMFWTQDLHHVCDYKYLLPVCGLSFHSLNGNSYASILVCICPHCSRVLYLGMGLRAVIYACLHLHSVITIVFQIGCPKFSLPSMGDGSQHSASSQVIDIDFCKIGSLDYELACFMFIFTLLPTHLGLFCFSNGFYIF